MSDKKDFEKSRALSLRASQRGVAAKQVGSTPGQGKSDEIENQVYHRRLANALSEIEHHKKRLGEIEGSLLWRLGKTIFFVEKYVARFFSKKRINLVDKAWHQKAERIIDKSQYWEPGLSEKLRNFGVTLEDLVEDNPGFLFLAPFEGSGGGMHSIVQEVAAMQRLGFRAKIASPIELQEHYLSGQTDPNHFWFYHNSDELLSEAFKVLIATYFVSVDLLEELWLKDPSILCGYYVQDYEPWFFHGGTEWERRAYRSYGRIPGMIHFAKTQFLCETLKERHGLDCHLIEPSLDHTVFKSPGEEEKVSPPLVVAMIRPKTPWRQPQKTLSVLGKLKKQMGTNISITTFGCDRDELFTIQPEEPFQFTHLGVLSGEEVAALFRRASIFLDLSVYQGFGRTGLEAMASGCVPILPENSGPSTYAVQRQNALLINTGDEKAAVDAAMDLLKDPRLWRKLAQAGLVTAKSFSPEVTALSQVLLFRPKADVLGNTDPN